jgi:hypothetical protein
MRVRSVRARCAPIWAALLVALAALSCGEDPAPGGIADVVEDPARDAGGDAAADVPDDAGDDTDDDTGGDAGEADLAPVCPPEAGEYGAPCATDEDCASGVCVTDPAGAGVCSATCLRACEALCDGRETFCRSERVASGALRFSCQLPAIDLCRACSADSQCEGGRCLDLGGRERACGQDCTSSEECPLGYQCGDGDPEHVGQCVPVSGTCSCTAEVDGVSRPCEVRNAAGACRGVQTCDAFSLGGWSACDARTPRAEVCNGFDDDCDGVRDDGVEVGGACEVPGEVSGDVADASCPGLLICQGEGGEACIGAPPLEDVCDGFDNDCDGIADQDFVDEAGRYSLLEHCGLCGNDCRERFPIFDDVDCETGDDEPRCVIRSCPAGYVLIGETACVPEQSSLCRPCESDTDCSAASPGARCVDLIGAGTPEAPEARVCGRDCSPESSLGEGCPDGYECRTLTLGEETAAQCVPIADTCSCIGNPPGFSVPCEERVVGEVDLDGTVGEVRCGGFATCEDFDFGACELPEDVCDGFDNDCSGVIDDGFRSAAFEGGPLLYLSDAHCGRCNNDCAERFDPDVDHAEGRCALEGDRPGCAMVCIDDERGRWVDLFNGEDDGCECEVVSERDVPDVDAGRCGDTRCDQNCDGVDGDASRALFVSKTGSDAAANGAVAAPLGTIQAAIERAIACRRGEAGAAYCPPGGARDIYVATGVYSENVVLDGSRFGAVDGLGIGLFGGYSLDFVERDSEANPTTVFGVRPVGQAIGTLTLRNIATTTEISGFSVYGFDALEPGASSYAVYIADSGEALVLRRNRIVGANGAAGAPGTPGSGGRPGGDGGSGRVGINTGTRACTTSTVAGGSGGANPECTAGGGAGGSGICPRALTSTGAECSTNNPTACLNECDEGGPCSTAAPRQGPGAAGQGNGGCAGSECGAGGAATYDLWADSGYCCVCGNQAGLPHLGQLGQPGRDGADGTGGGGCGLVGGVVVDGRWVGSSGGAGVADATAGGGGGGGSAGAGFAVVADALTCGDGSDCTDNIGGSGGGGGAGGCSGTAGGGGSGGGSSFGVFLYYSPGAATISPPVIETNVFVRGQGGPGGNGGGGGAGGLGGSGGSGGFTFPNQAFCTRPGGAGGNGGDGGDGAGGGGGCGGNTFGVFVYRNGNDVPTARTDGYRSPFNQFPGSGSAGPGGIGGVSSGDAGAQGGNGDSGVSAAVRVQ